MASIDKLRASNGSANASVATVQSSRSSGSSTIVVNTVTGINTNFMGTMGTPHTFTDPITSETITVISEATAVDFSGHVSGINLVIDTIAPGYVDLGSAVGDIVVIRPTTQWGNGVADVLGVVHNDDGTLKDNIVTAPKLVGVDKSNLTTDSNPYKFSAYRSAAWTASNAGPNKVLFDAELFDTNNNFDSTTNHRYTAPISGFYQFSWYVTFTLGAGAIGLSQLRKNGTAIATGGQVISGAGVQAYTTNGSILVQAAANDYFEVYDYADNRAGAAGSEQTAFSGFLVSRT